MTNDEAIKYIIRHCNPDYPNGKTEWETAINMAIEALEKQCVPDTNVGDTVYRQDAIDAIINNSYPVRYDYGFTSIENGMTVTGIKQALNELPSAEPFFDKEKVSDLLHHIFEICSPHTNAMDVIARNYYFEELGKELFGEDIPAWMQR